MPVLLHMIVLYRDSLLVVAPADELQVRTPSHPSPLLMLFHRLAVFSYYDLALAIIPPYTAFPTLGGRKGETVYGGGGGWGERTQ